MSTDSYNKLKRYGSIFVAIGLWAISILFSTKGFSFEVSMGNWVNYVGVFLGLAITVLELDFNGMYKARGQVNMTLFVLGVAAYGYGVISNFIGIWAAQGNMAVTLDALMMNLVQTGFVMFLALLIEIAPEALLVYGIMGMEASGEGDLFRAMTETNLSNRHPSGRPDRI